MNTPFVPIVPKPGDDPWALSIQANAYYERPLKDGKRIGPLVPYSGKDSQGRNYVGHVYYNFARIEEHPSLCAYFAKLLADKIPKNLMPSVTTIVGIPDGGRTFGQDLARELGLRFVYPAKVSRPKGAGAVKEEYDLVFKRFELGPSDVVLVADDVHNNFQQTDGCLNNILDTGATVVGLCSAFNRSPKVDKVYLPKSGKLLCVPISVFSAIRKACDEFEEDHPEVVEDFAAGNIELKVKDNWAQLRKVMEQNK